eukprot:5211162-Pleurochrysis_carterae.AAC.1
MTDRLVCASAARADHLRREKQTSKPAITNHQIRSTLASAVLACTRKATALLLVVTTTFAAHGRQFSTGK